MKNQVHKEIGGGLLHCSSLFHLLACLCVLLPGSLGGQGQSPRLCDVNGDKDTIHSPSVFKTFYSVSVTFEDSLCAQVWLQKHDWEGGIETENLLRAPLDTQQTDCEIADMLALVSPPPPPPPPKSESPL